MPLRLQTDTVANKTNVKGLDMTPIEQMAKQCGAEFTDWQNGEPPEITFYGGLPQLELFVEALRQAIIKDFVNGLENPVAWTSPDRSVLHRVTKDTFFGSHTIPLFDLSQWRDK